MARRLHSAGIVGDFGSYIPDGLWDRGVLGGFLCAMLFFVAVCFYRAVRRIVLRGWRHYLASALRIEDDSLGLFLVLLGLLGVVVFVFRR